jgi:O-antigen biosynthesis alpha-1,3-mannosyltransferase
MKVILGCDPLLQPLTGIGNYTYRLGLGLKESKEVSDLRLFAHGKFFSLGLLEPQKITDSDNTINQEGITSKIRRVLASSTIIVKVYQLLLPLINRIALQNFSQYIYHSPNFILPNFEGKKIVTIHDLSTIRFPEYHPKARVAFINKAIADAIEVADHIITDSEFVRSEIVELYGVNLDNITAIGLGADSYFKPRNVNECAEVLSSYEIEFGQYFLFVSTIEPRKNIENLLDAYILFRKKNRCKYPLILIGGKGWNNERIFEKISSLEAKGWVKYLGYLPQNHIPLIYSGARALLFPSTYEGFGLPVLEAMQSGIPVMTSINSSMSEITQDKALLIDPQNIEAIVKAIVELATNDELVGQLSAGGIERSRDFSWDIKVKKTLDIYKKLS